MNAAPFPLHDLFAHEAMNGVTVPPFCPPSRAMALKTDFKPRPSDIIIATYEKSGTTWLSNMIYCLLDYPNGPVEQLSQVVPWLQAVPPMGVSLEVIEDMKSPRLVLIRYFKK